MNKTNKTKSSCEDRKHLIRHPDDPKEKETTVQHNTPVIEQKESAPKVDISKPKIPDPVPVIDLEVPKLNSTNCVKKRMIKLEIKKPTRIKGVSDLCVPQKATLDDQITKQMNVPFDKKLYKQLISLNLSNKPIVQQTSTNYEPSLRDKVPKLEDFFTPPANFEYSIPVTSNIDLHSTSKQFDGLRLDKVIRTWKDK